ncbi:MAG: hypothetical protein AAGB46_14090 [Verrucomicrobiota bacterium]
MEVFANEQALEELKATLKKQASWFYWIAGLSLVNTIAIASGADFAFIMGLGITQIIDAIGFTLAEEGVAFASTATTIISLIICGLYGAIGYMAINQSKVAHLVGIILYSLDTLIFLVFFDIMPLAFHGLALFFLFKGFQTQKDIKAVQEALKQTPEEPMLRIDPQDSI